MSSFVVANTEVCSQEVMTVACEVCVRCFSLVSVTFAHKMSSLNSEHYLRIYINKKKNQCVFLKELILLRRVESEIVVESSGGNVSSRHCSCAPPAPVISCHDNKHTSSEFQQCVSNRWQDPRFSLPPSLPLRFRLMCPAQGSSPKLSPAAIHSLPETAKLGPRERKVEKNGFF